MFYPDDLTVVGQFYAFGQAGIHLFVKADVMTGMNEVGMLSPYPADELHGLADGLMGMVLGGETQGIDHHHLHTLQIGQFAVVDGFHIGNIGKVADAES